MIICIERRGVLLGKYPEDEVRQYLETGMLLDSDLAYTPELERRRPIKAFLKAGPEAEKAKPKRPIISAVYNAIGIVVAIFAILLFGTPVYAISFGISAVLCFGLAQLASFVGEIAHYSRLSHEELTKMRDHMESK